jgi:hypothetical protein
MDLIARIDAGKCTAKMIRGLYQNLLERQSKILKKPNSA